MGKSSLFFFALVACAGAAGAVAAHLVARSDDPASVAAEAPPPREPSDGFRPSREEWEALRLELGNLRSQVGELTAKLEDATSRLGEVESGDTAVLPPDEAVANLLKTAKDGTAISSLPKRLVALPGSGGVLRLGELGKTAELMALPEEERWARIREDLSLDAWQEDELKRLAQEMSETTRKMFTAKEGEEPDFGTAISKMMEQRTKANERVKNLLSDEQYKKFKSGGYGGAIGLGSTSVAVTYSSTSVPRDSGDK